MADDKLELVEELMALRAENERLRADRCIRSAESDGRRIQDLRAENEELRKWRDDAVASCAKKQCSMMELLLGEARAENERLRQERRDARAAAIREMRAWAVQSWLEQVETKKQYDPNTADRRECQAMANAYQTMAFHCDTLLAAAPQPGTATETFRRAAENCTGEMRDDHEEQRRSFAAGNVGMSNPDVTREVVDRVADSMPPTDDDINHWLRRATAYSRSPGLYLLVRRDIDLAVQMMRRARVEVPQPAAPTDAVLARLRECAAS